MGWVVHYRLCFPYGLAENPHYDLLVRILSAYKNFDVPPGFLFDKDPVFDCKSTCFV